MLLSIVTVIGKIWPDKEWKESKIESKCLPETEQVMNISGYAEGGGEDLEGKIRMNRQYVGVYDFVNRGFITGLQSMTLEIPQLLDTVLILSA